MVWIYYQGFTKHWIERAERQQQLVDDGDRFISLWIAFNGWLKDKYGEEMRDADLIKEVKTIIDLKTVFTTLMQKNQEFSDRLESLKGYSVIDMRKKRRQAQPIEFDGTLEKLIDVIYRVRCNLFHGRKDVDEDRKDRELVGLTYSILIVLFKKYLTEYEPDYIF